MNGQRRVVAYMLFMALTWIGMAGWITRQYDDAQKQDLHGWSLKPGPDYVCTYEDMLPVKLAVDWKGYHEGDIVCIHVDQFVDLRAAMKDGKLDGGR